MATVDKNIIHHFCELGRNSLQRKKMELKFGTLLGYLSKAGPEKK